MTALKLDHIVHNVNDLDTAIKVFKENGLAASRGGSHKDWGTYNALSYFGLSYIEFLGIENREVAIGAARSYLLVEDAINLLPQNQVFSRVAIRTDDIENVASALKEKGLELSPVLEGNRLNTYGKLIQWRLLFLKGDYQGLVYPFFIQWQDSEKERLESLTASGMIQPHSQGITVLKNVVFTVNNPQEVAQHWQELFNLPLHESNPNYAGLSLGEHHFIFRKGISNRIEQLELQTTEDNFKGKRFFIGEGQYIFL